MAENVQGQKFEDVQDGDPRTVILNYRKDEGTLVYTNREGQSKKIVKPFNDIFNSINSKVLAANTDIILPTGCVYRTRLQNGKEAFLMQEQPGVRTFRISQREAATNLVSKMYNKFEAQTRVLEKNEVTPEKKEEVKKQIALRKQYMSQQKISENDRGQHYKYFFRVYFPYSYIIITIDKTHQKHAARNKLQFSGMHAAIALEPINNLNDYVYQFPLSNVSQGGNVCTGQLPLGNYGHINVKTYVEKMTGYFWNNKFNADITAGPETYGDKNFLGNWFEWEFISYVNPAAVLSLDFNEEGIKSKRLSVGKYVYNSSDHNGRIRVHTINETSFVEGFQSSDVFGDASVDIENGVAKKTMEGIAQSMTLEGYDIPLGTIIKTDTKKFKIVSYDGFRTYNVDDSTLYEKDIVLTHYKLKEQNGGIHTMTLSTQGKTFLANAYRKARNFVLEANFDGITYKSGELIAYDIDGDFVSEANIAYDMIKSIREQEKGYIIELYQRGDSMRLRRDTTPKEIRKVEIVFSGATDDIHIKDNEEFTFRTCKVIKDNNTPMPYMIRDHLSAVCKASVEIDAILYKEEPRRSYQYGSSTNTKGFHIDYTLKKDGMDDEEQTARVKDCILKLDDGNLQLSISLPEYIQLSSQEFEEVTPRVKGSELTIIGHRALQTISSDSTPEKVPFKIMRDAQGDVRISTVDVRRKSSENMFFKPSNDHLKTCIRDIDGMLQFKVRDLFEVGTEREYIKFNVGDEILLSSDWDPRRNVPPSVKKIYDFITIEERSEKNMIYVSTGRNEDYITNGMPNTTADMIIDRYKKYAKQVESLDKSQKRNPMSKGFSAPKGVLYAVVKDDHDRLIFHPMIDSEGRHYLNGISHVKKEIGDLKAGDFIKADVGKIPYFAKKVVDEIVCFADINGRELCILKSGYTMWHDIVEKGFKVFHRANLTDGKIEFYKEKVRQPAMHDFMVIYGDQYFGQIGTPILTRHDDHKEDDANRDDYKVELFKAAYETGQHTNGMTKDMYDRLRNINESPYFETFAETCLHTKMTVRLDSSMGSFRSLFNTNLTLGNNQNSTGNAYDHVGYIGQAQRFYDICYSLDNRSLTNGSAYMPMDDCFYRPMVSYTYYSSPYKVGKSWLSQVHIKVGMLTIPTPRMLKKSTRDKKSFKVYKLMGPQNRFYNFVTSDQLSKRNTLKQDHIAYNITSDEFLPAMEE